MGFFNEEDVKAGVRAVLAWFASFPEAGQALRDVWLAHYMKCGHKNLARVISKGEANEAN